MGNRKIISKQQVETISRIKKNLEFESLVKRKSLEEIIKNMAMRVSRSKQN